MNDIHQLLFGLGVLLVAASVVVGLARKPFNNRASHFDLVIWCLKALKSWLHHGLMEFSKICHRLAKWTWDCGRRNGGWLMVAMGILASVPWFTGGVLKIIAYPLK